MLLLCNLQVWKLGKLLQAKNPILPNQRLSNFLQDPSQVHSLSAYIQHVLQAFETCVDLTHLDPIYFDNRTMFALVQIRPSYQSSNLMNHSRVLSLTSWTSPMWPEQRILYELNLWCWRNGLSIEWAISMSIHSWICAHIWPQRSMMSTTHVAIWPFRFLHRDPQLS